MSFNRCIKNERCHGFTLIELSVVLVIIGLLVAGMVQAYSLYYKKQQVDITKKNIDNALEKIAAFQGEYGYLPCPAAVDSPTLRATDCNDPSAAGVQRVATGVSGQILRIGVLPVSFQDPSTPSEIKMLTTGDSVTDGWKNRLTYAVIEQTARDATGYANTPTGSIRVNYQDGTTATSTARYVVFSHGPDGVGAYSYSGALRTPCIAGSSVDAANCDGDALFVANGLAEARSTSGGSSNFDDFIASEGTSLSSKVCAENEEIRGINFATKEPICVPRNLNCPTGRAFVGIRWEGPNGDRRIEPECRLFTTACSPGFVLATVNPNGSPVCVRNRTGSCPSGFVQVGVDEAGEFTNGVKDDDAFGEERCVQIVSSCPAGQVQVGTAVAANGAIVASCAPRMLNDRCTGRTILVGYYADGKPNCVSAPSCPANEYMNGLLNGVPVCGKPLKDMTCPDGKVVKGITNGNLVCEPLVDTNTNLLVVRGGGVTGLAEFKKAIDNSYEVCMRQRVSWPGGRTAGGKADTYCKANVSGCRVTAANMSGADFNRIVQDCSTHYCIGILGRNPRLSNATSACAGVPNSNAMNHACTNNIPSYAVSCLNGINDPVWMENTGL